MAISLRKPLRLWPGVVTVILLWLIRFGLPAAVPGAVLYAMLGEIAGGFLIVVWWIFFSRAPWLDRMGAIILMIVGLSATSRIADVSIATGAKGTLLYLLAIPVLSLAFVAGAVASHRLSDGPRRATMAAIILLACGVWALVRTGGLTADFHNDLQWRWAKTPEERLVAQGGVEAKARPPVQAETVKGPPAAKADGKSTAWPAPPPAAAAAPSIPLAAKTGADWPGFRGGGRDGTIRGVRIETDWSKFPPVELWRRPVGPGWSSFAVGGDLLYTQEQRGDDEVVACYKVSTGEPMWMHGDAVRFYESNGGAGPRATPTLSNGRVYTCGGTGILNALDARNGAIAWTRNAAADAGAKVPYYGFSSSPLVVGDIVVVYAGVLAAYDGATGNPRWTSQVNGGSYSSPHLLRIDGISQVLQLTGAGVTSTSPADGTRLWEHQWKGASIVQPAFTADGSVFVAAVDSGGIGMRRIAVASGSGGWKAEERWTSTGLKPYFNDFVIHQGYAFGFDGGILACIDIKDGSRKWKGGHYGYGQLVLLRDQDLLLVLTEEGELALVRALPDQFMELARFPAIEGKTWNHPALAGNILLVRNGQEMAAFRIALADGSVK